MRARALFLVACLGLLTACSQPAPTPGQPDPVDAYQVIVRWLYSTDPGLNNHIFAIDTTQTGLPDPDRLFAALNSDPEYAQHEMMNTTRADLEQAGLIGDVARGFPDGFLIEFSDAVISTNQVKVHGSKWVSGLGAIYATLTVDWKGGPWALEAVDNFMIA